MSKFTAQYFINKYSDGDNGFDHELLEHLTIFEDFYEETSNIGEYTDTYDEVLELLKDKGEGEYCVFIMGDISYDQDYYGESDISVEITYSSVVELEDDL